MAKPRRPWRANRKGPLFRATWSHRISRRTWRRVRNGCGPRRNPAQARRGEAPRTQRPIERGGRASFRRLGVGFDCGAASRVALGFGGSAFVAVSFPFLNRHRRRFGVGRAARAAVSFAQVYFPPLAWVPQLAGSLGALPAPYKETAENPPRPPHGIS